MNTEMFCFQCEQTAGCSGCTGKAGVCGKKAETAGLQDRLTGALISLARDEERAGREKLPEAVAELMMRGLFATVTNVNFDDVVLEDLIQEVHKKKETEDYNMEQLWGAEEDIRSLKSLILFGLRGMAAYAWHAAVLGYQDEEVNRFFCTGLAAVGTEQTMEPVSYTHLLLSAYDFTYSGSGGKKTVARGKAGDRTCH